MLYAISWYVELSFNGTWLDVLRYDCCEISEEYANIIYGDGFMLKSFNPCAEFPRNKKM